MIRDFAGLVGQDSLQADQGSRDGSSADFHPDYVFNDDHFDKTSVIRRSLTRKRRFVFRFRSSCYGGQNG
jgi:hypothetical protein